MLVAAVTVTVVPEIEHAAAIGVVPCTVATHSGVVNDAPVVTEHDLAGRDANVHRLRARVHDADRDGSRRARLQRRGFRRYGYRERLRGTPRARGCARGGGVGGRCGLD